MALVAWIYKVELRHTRPHALHRLCNRPLLHALVYPGVKATLGVELDEIKVQKARVFLKQSVQRVQRKGLLPEDLELPIMQCAAIEEVRLERERGWWGACVT